MHSSVVASWWHAGNHFYQFFLLRTDRYNKKLKKYYVEIEELDEDLNEEEELEREEEREACLLFMLLYNYLSIPMVSHLIQNI